VRKRRKIKATSESECISLLALGGRGVSDCRRGVWKTRAALLGKKVERGVNVKIPAASLSRKNVPKERPIPSTKIGLEERRLKGPPGLYEE